MVSIVQYLLTAQNPVCGIGDFHLVLQGFYKSHGWPPKCYQSLIIDLIYNCWLVLQPFGPSFFLTLPANTHHMPI